MPHRRSAALTAAALLFALTACAAAPSPSTATPTSDYSPKPSAAATPATTPTPTPTPVAQFAEPTCANIMSASFTTTWVPVRIEEPQPVFAEGIQCRWQADPTVGTDNILSYGWAPAERSDWDALVAEHTSGDGSTWFVETEERGQYLTQKTEYWVQDDEGYGSTYLFTGDAIISAMTKAETDDVTGPPVVHG